MDDIQKIWQFCYILNLFYLHKILIIICTNDLYKNWTTIVYFYLLDFWYFLQVYRYICMQCIPKLVCQCNIFPDPPYMKRQIYFWKPLQSPQKICVFLISYFYWSLCLRLRKNQVSGFRGNLGYAPCFFQNFQNSKFLLLYISARK